MSTLSKCGWVLVLVPVLVAGCGAPGRIPDPTFERVGRSEDPAADEDQVYSWRDGTHPAQSRPARSPTFSCCEDAFRVRGIRVAGATNARIRDGGREVSEIRIEIEASVEVNCQRLVAEGEGTRGEPLTCNITFEEVSRTTQPAFSVNPGGARMTPAGERIWWAAEEERCTRRRRTASLRIVYIGRFPDLGVPRAVSGEAPSRVVLLLTAKTGGRNHEVTLDLRQLNQDRPLEVTPSDRPL